MSDSPHGRRLRGLAFNPAAPSDVLVRLLDPAAGDAGPLMCQGRDLPDAVIDAALRHPSRVIRGALARNRYVDPARLAPLASDPSGLVRARLAAGPRHYLRRVRPLPDDILVSLLTAQDGGADNRVTAKEIIGELESSRQIPLSFFRSIAGHAHPELRTVATWRWESLTPEQRAALLDDPDPGVRETARDRNWALDPEQVEARLPSFGSRNAFVFGTCALSPALVERCFADGTVLPMARNPHTPPYALARLARHPDAEVRASVAVRPDAGPDLVAELTSDPVAYVRMCARLHPFSRTWAEYRAIDQVLGHGPDCTCPIGEPFTEAGVDPAVGPPPDWFATCAVSEEAVLRRVAASWPGLPAELAGTLAQDDDEEVRIRLACRHPLAPPHLLLDVFVTRPVHRPDLRDLPAFPRTGRAHLIDHPDPEVRALAAADPAVPDPPLEDPDASVRQAAAANPSLSPEALESLLTDPRTAEGAASNPALSFPRMHALLDDCLNGTAAVPTPVRR
ncbi:hypothetical protein ABZ307_21760 [Streptomyces griseorubiginosus]|uniref:hypothetical protein n=1 Tax=Streptomyces griseorubiginosus TaxID=67304 RepID=UPI0033BF4CC5